MRTKLTIIAATLAGLAAGCGAQAHENDEDDLATATGSLGARHARGAFSCDFGIPAGVPPEALPPGIERDRMYMSARPGMIDKHIPFSFDLATGNLFSGGRYLFERRRDAADYHDFVARRYVLDGVQFLARPIFLAPECHDWTVVGHEELGDLHTTHVVMRTERFAMTGKDAVGALTCRWPGIRREAARRGYTSVALMYNDDEHLAALVYYAGRVAPADPTAPDFASLGALGQATALGEPLAQLGWPRTFDRTQWVLTVWFPFAPGDHGPPSVWPSSPPFPAPFCSDGVCEVSRGENAQVCPTDCPVHCGNAVCDAGEDTHNCPGDCRL